MSFARILLSCCVALLLGGALSAGVREIRRDKLPREESVARAYEDVSGIEEMVKDWSEKWPYKTPRERVVAKLESSLAALRAASARSPDNEELELLTAWTAAYSYNFDLKDSMEVALDATQKAKKLAPEDYRPDWIRAALGCRTAQDNLDGMKRFLRLEAEGRSDSYPYELWDDYLRCAIVTHMPSHALRAGDRIAQFQGKTDGVVEELVRFARNQMRAADPAASYTDREVWYSENHGSLVEFQSFVFDLAFQVHFDWHIQFSGAQKGFGTAQIEAGPYPNGKNQVTPNIVFLVRPAKPGESPDDFLKALARQRPPKEMQERPCPSAPCLTFDSLEKGTYGENGDGHLLITVFARKMPPYPGIAFEESAQIPLTAGTEVQYFRAEQRLNRLGGTLYYAVLLDTASTIFQPSLEAYREVLKSIRVE